MGNMDNKKDDIAKQDAEFRRIIYCSTENRFVIFTMNQMITKNQWFFKIADQLNESERDMIFADYVGVLKGLEQNNAFQVEEMAKDNILRMCELLIKYTGLQVSDVIKNVMKI